MGYTTSFQGEFTCNPALNSGQVAKLKKFTGERHGEYGDGVGPGAWCQWEPSDDGVAILWDEGEKFGNYEEWINHLLEHFLTPWGVTLSGQITWQGEERDDFGILVADVDTVCGYVGERGFPGLERTLEKRKAQPVAVGRRTVILEIDVFDQDLSDAQAIESAIKDIMLGEVPRTSVVS